jgi:hypothetical protein
MSDQTPHRRVDIESAMAVDAMPDETRTGEHADETDAALMNSGEVTTVDDDGEPRPQP